MAKRSSSLTPSGSAANVDTKPRARRASGAQKAGGATDVHSVATAPQPTEEEIRQRAYQRYLDRGGAHGLDFDDWLHAERELKGKTKRTVS